MYNSHIDSSYWQLNSPYIIGNSADLDSITVQMNGYVPDTLLYTVINNYGCSYDLPVYIDLAPQLTYSLSSTPDCDSTQVGAAIVAISGNVSLDSANWYGEDPTMLLPGTYYVEMIDEYGCSNIDSVAVGHNTIVIDTLVVDSVECYGGADGGVALILDQINPPYQFDWQGVTPQALAAGNYTVMVTDGLGCAVQIDYEVGQPAPIAIAVDQIVHDAGAGGSIDLTVTGGTPYYTYLWSYNGTQTEDIQAPFGTYLFTVSDANGCQADTSLVIQNILGLHHSENGFNIYPNPAQGPITIASTEPYQLTVFDLSGRVISRQQGHAGESTLELPHGVYVIAVDTASGRFTEKLVVTD